MDKIASMQAMFYVYAALGLLGAFLYSRLPHAKAPQTASQPAALGPSRRTIYKLAALFSLDAFASGFVVQSVLALWLFKRFELSLAAASTFFSGPMFLPLSLILSPPGSGSISAS